MNLPKEVILEQVSDFFSKTIGRYARKERKQKQDIQLVLALDENGKNIYKLLVDFMPKMYLKLEDIVGIMYYALLKNVVPEQISGALLNFAVEAGVRSSEMSILIFADEEEELHYCVYKGTEMMRTATLDECIMIKEDESDDE